VLIIIDYYLTIQHIDQPFCRIEFIDVHESQLTLR